MPFEFPPVLLPEPLLPFPPPLPPPLPLPPPFPPPLPPPPPPPLPPPLPPPPPPPLPSFACACFTVRTRREPPRSIVTGDAATTRAAAALPPSLRKSRFEIVMPLPHSSFLAVPTLYQTRANFRCFED
ncbi:hypothetical protein FFR93_38855 [Rhizobium sp. MHM7A]|nr:hypothetical protein FFR93_38855 [Rhizobium sp. MHM7A]